MPDDKVDNKVDVFAKYRKHLVKKVDSKDDVVDNEEKTVSQVTAPAILLREFFGITDIEARDPKKRDKLLYIYKEAGGGTKDKVYASLNTAENKIGHPKLGVSRLDHIYNYYRLKERAVGTFGALREYATKNSDNTGKADSVGDKPKGPSKDARVKTPTVQISIKSG